MEKSASIAEMLDFFSLRTSDLPPLRHSINQQMTSGTMSSSMPVYVHFQRSRGGIESSEGKAPLTIFYNGTVTVFDVPGRKVGDILKLAVSGAQMDWPDMAGTILSGEQREFLGTLTRDLPMARRISLQRFLEKRKESFSRCRGPTKALSPLLDLT